MATTDKKYVIATYTFRYPVVEKDYPEDVNIDSADAIVACDTENHENIQNLVDMSDDPQFVSAKFADDDDE